MELWSYSPDQVDVLIAGFYEVEGFPEGTFIEITKDLMPVTTQRTTDGQIARKRVTNSTYTVRISLLAASAGNNLFTRLWRFDEETDLGKFPLLIRDRSGSGYFFSATTWIEEIPTLTYSTDMTTNTWVFRSNQGTLNIGGNSPQSDIENLTDLALSGLPYITSVIERLGV